MILIKCQSCIVTHADACKFRNNHLVTKLAIVSFLQMKIVHSSGEHEPLYELPFNFRHSKRGEGPNLKVHMCECSVIM